MKLKEWNDSIKLLIMATESKYFFQQKQNNPNVIAYIKADW